MNVYCFLLVSIYFIHEIIKNDYDDDFFDEEKKKIKIYYSRRIKNTSYTRTIII